MSRSYKGVRLKKNRVYSVEQLAAAYSVTANTVSNWVGEGLKRSDDQRPYLFRGANVLEFHRRQRVGPRRKLLPGQFYFRGCQTEVFPEIETVEDFRASNGKHMYSAQCPTCSNKLSKISSETDRDKVEDCRNPNTPTECLHKEKTSERGGIWTNDDKIVGSYHTENDRVIHKWQTYAGCFGDKTIDKHLAAIRFFESVLDGKPFSRLTTEDFASVRDELKRRSRTDAEDSLSASSIKHTVSHLLGFSDWLLKQDGYRRLPRDLDGYLKLPKAVVAQAAQVKKRDFPTISEAEDLLKAMPSKSLVDERARALFALGFLGALRADTLISLRLEHFDIERRRILQHAKIVRAKAGKSLDISWFWIPEIFEETVIGWVDNLKSLGFTDQDALFPDTKHLKHRVATSAYTPAPVPVMSTKHAVTNAFAVACSQTGAKYTPHCVKHSIGALRDSLLLTQEERNAWSLNMGHDDERTTERYYGTMRDDQRFEVLANIGTKNTIDTLSLTTDQKARAFDAMIKAIGE